MSELEALIRKIAREEALRVVLEANRGNTSPPPAGLVREFGEAIAGEAGVCGATDERGWVCRKPKHRGRHKFTPKPHVPPERNWEPVETATVEGSTGRKYEIKPGHPVKVRGLGRSGAAGDGYKVVSMERHTANGKVNVEVVKEGRNQRSRVVPLDRIVYKRPKKG